MRAWSFFPIGLLALALAALAAACDGGGGGDELTLEEYFQQMETISNQGRDDLLALQEQFPDASAEPQEMLAFFDGFIEIFGMTMDQVAALDPPGEAEDAHEEFRDAGEELVELGPSVSERLAQVASTADLEAFFEELNQNEELNEASRRFDDACNNLQAIADDNGINADLRCLGGR